MIFGAGESKTVVHSLDSLAVKVELDGTIIDSGLSGNGNYDSDSAGSFSVDFSGLAVNEKIGKVTSESEPTKIVIKVYEQSGSVLIGETTLNLDSNYNSKNSVTVIIDNTESAWTR